MSSRSTSPLTGVAELDATILSYLDIGALQYLYLDLTYDPSTPALALFAYDSLIWSLKLGMTLGIDIPHGYGIPYRALLVGATAGDGPITLAPGEVWSNMSILGRTLEIQVKRLIETVAWEADVPINSLGRETGGLLMAVIDYLIYVNSVRLERPLTIMDDKQYLYSGVSIAIVETGWLDGLRTFLGRSDANVRNDGSVVPPLVAYSNRLSADAAPVEANMSARAMVRALVDLMEGHPDVSIDDLRRLIAEYILPLIAPEDDYGTIYIHHLPRDSIDHGIDQVVETPINPIHMLDMHSYIRNMASSGDMLQFYLEEIVPLTAGSYSTTLSTGNWHNLYIDKLIAPLLLSRQRHVDDYSTLDPNRWYRVNELLGVKVNVADLEDHRLLVGSIDVQAMLITVLLEKVRTVEQAERFMVWVSENTVDRIGSDAMDLEDIASDEENDSEEEDFYDGIWKALGGDLAMGDWAISRYFFPFLIYAYKAYRGELTEEMVTALIKTDDTITTPLTRYGDIVALITEALLAGRTVRKASDRDPSYALLVQLMRAIGSRWSDDENKKGSSLYSSRKIHGTPYSVIASAMYNESIFRSALSRLGPKPNVTVDDSVAIDVLVEACAKRYSDAAANSPGSRLRSSWSMPNRIEQLDSMDEKSWLTKSDSPSPLGHDILAAYRSCMDRVIEFYLDIVPSRQVWEDNVNTTESEGYWASRSTRSVHPGVLLWDTFQQLLPINPVAAAAIIPVIEPDDDRYYTDIVEQCRYDILRLPTAEAYEAFVRMIERVYPSEAEANSALVGDGDAGPDGGSYDGSDDDERDRDEWGSAIIASGGVLNRLRTLLPLIWDVDKYEVVEWAGYIDDDMYGDWAIDGV